MWVRNNIPLSIIVLLTVKLHGPFTYPSNIKAKLSFENLDIIFNRFTSIATASFGSNNYDF